MKTSEQCLLRSIFIISVMLVSAGIVHGVGVGISPTSVSMPNVLRGGYAETNLVLSNPSSEDINYLVQITSDNQSSWFSFEPFTSGVLPARSTMAFKVIAQPPVYVATGNYSATITFFAAPTVSGGGGTGAKIVAGVAIPVRITVNDTEVLSYRMDNVYISPSEECYPIKMYISVTNDGNVRTTPFFHIAAYDINGNFVKDYNYTGDDLLPTVSKKFTVQFPYDMPTAYQCIVKGSYNFRTDAYLNGNLVGTIIRPLDLLERGAITVRGELANLTLPEATSAGQLIKISANFTNIGQVEVGAKLKTEEYLNSTLVSAQEGDMATVEPQTSAIISTYFTPQQPGNYTINAWAVFEGKTTDTLNSTLIVTEMQIPYLEITIAAIIGLIAVIAIAVLIRRRRNE